MSPTAGSAGPRRRPRRQFDHNGPHRRRPDRDFVNGKLFPYLQGFKERATGPDTIEYKIGEIFSEIRNKFASGYSLRDALELIDGLSFRSQAEKHELSTCTRRRSATWATPGATAASTTRRAR
jgi:hypothetical protein